MQCESYQAFDINPYYIIEVFIYNFIIQRKHILTSHSSHTKSLHIYQALHNYFYVILPIKVQHQVI